MKRLIALLMALMMMILPAVAEEQQLTPADFGWPDAAGYVRITAGSDYAWYPLPATEEETFDVTIQLTDGEGNLYKNVVRITPTGTYMLSSNCDNQDCIGEGEVTLENMSTRVLANWIVCLPHQVSVELYSAQEIVDMLLSAVKSAE
jgi:hypothetical protein